jgi:hypothetical protein
VARFDPLQRSDPPPITRANLGPYDTIPSQDPLAGSAKTTFSSRQDEAWIQLAPAREDEIDAPHARRAGRVEHFDDESRSAEGRFLSDGTLAFAAGDRRLEWNSTGGLLRPLALSLWVRPRTLEEGVRLLDVGGAFTDLDRVSLSFEKGNLVLRVIDGAGDHPTSSFAEVAELRYPLSGEGPGVPVDAWTHVALDVRGNRPDQMTLFVDGMARAKTPGLTRLTAGVNVDASVLPVESTEGFPARCVVRLGEELCEVVVDGTRALRAQFSPLGELAGFGGRLAREEFRGVDPGLSAGVSKQTGYASGTTVELYGYSLPLFENAPSASATLNGSLAPFAVARVSGIVKSGSPKLGPQMEPITISALDGTPITVGFGMDAVGDDVQGLVLVAADPNGDPARAIRAFSPSGGYAALLSIEWNFVVSSGGGVTTADRDSSGVRIGGVEVVHYSGWNADQLLIDRRGDQLPELKNLSGQAVPDQVKGRAAMIFDPADYVYFGQTPADTHMVCMTMIVPISLGVQGGGGVVGFAPATIGDSQFVQVTRLDTEPHLTEWVRYDEFVSGQLVRDDPAALLEANSAAHAGNVVVGGEGTVPGGGTGGNGGSGDPDQPSGSGGGGGGSPSATLAAAPAVTQGSQSQGGSYWHYAMGEPEDEDLLITRSVRSRFQFRGVLGTYPHEQPSGALVLPAIKLVDHGLSGGWPGRFDHVMLMEADPSSPGTPGIVQRAHRPRSYTVHNWAEGSAPLSVQQGAVDAELGHTGFDVVAGQGFLVYAALQEALRLPVAAGALSGTNNLLETRLQGRMVLFPSGERPREAQSVQIGGDFRSPRSAVPSALIDELVFGGSDLGASAGLGDALFGGALVLAAAMDEGSSGLRTLKQTLRTPYGDNGYASEFLGELDPDGGLLRSGDEYFAYEQVDPGSQSVTIPANGRGLLGTEPQAHAAGEAIHYLSQVRVAVLAGGVGAQDALLVVTDLAGLPPSGTALVDQELLHFTHHEGSALAMPRASLEPGKMDRKGAGLFRGRYGTRPAAHVAGSPVILFPFRYWDRWSERADAPEMHWFGLDLEEPSGYWRSSFWRSELPASGAPRLGVLERRDPATPWDADPGEVDGLALWWEGEQDGQGNPIDVQADRIEWRAFVRHDPGSFDFATGASHAWKGTPRLNFFGVEYLGPGMVLRRVER